jgi:hypothetical protein
MHDFAAKMHDFAAKMRNFAANVRAFLERACAFSSNYQVITSPPLGLRALRALTRGYATGFPAGNGGKCHAP